MTAPTTPGAFRGTWRLHRTINDRLAGQQLTGQGTATLGPDWLWSERLTLTWPDGQHTDGLRRYRWVPQGRAIAILFEDDRPFHKLVLGQLHWAAQHDCEPDTYMGRYDFSDWPRWQVTWQVHGPRKDYLMVSQLAPVDDPPAARY